MNRDQVFVVSVLAAFGVGAFSFDSHPVASSLTVAFGAVAAGAWAFVKSIRPVPKSLAEPERRLGLPRAHEGAGPMRPADEVMGTAGVGRALLRSLGQPGTHLRCAGLLLAFSFASICAAVLPEELGWSIPGLYASADYLFSLTFSAAIFMTGSAAFFWALNAFLRRRAAALDR